MIPSMVGVAAAAGLALWIAVLVAPWRPWLCRERLEASPAGRAPAADLSDVTALIPARNEAEVIERSLRGLARQGRGLRVVLVDDGSTDGTARIARETFTESAPEGPELEVVDPGPPPAGWTGKLWALEAGRGEIDSPLTLLLDADVELDPGLIAALRSRLLREDLGMASLMAAPRMEGVWERLLMPAFVWFFKLLYPFRLVSDPGSRVAAAAGGCVLLETRVLERVGGLRSIRAEIIDDCALAGRVKASGARIWIGLTRSARSVRPRGGLGDIWEMVARTAYPQLRYSPLLLAGCTLLLALAFWAPPAAASSGEPATVALGAAGLAGMVLAYLPVLRYYGRSPAWALLLPVTATLYLAMTWTSALRHWQGRGSRWKGRSYGAPEEQRRESADSAAEHDGSGRPRGERVPREAGPGRGPPEGGDGRGLSPRVLVVWREQWPRAMLRAELRERGYDAVGSRDPAAGLRELEEAPGRGPVRLLVVDQRTAEIREREWSELREAAGPVPVLLLARSTTERPCGSWAAVLERPLSVGRVADQVERLVPAPGPREEGIR